MTATDELTLERAGRRIVRSMAALGAVGTVAAWAAWGWRYGAGFLLGALISGLNFLFIRGMVNSLGGARPHGGWRMAVRYPLLAACAYVILRFSPIRVSAVLAGIFVFTAAVFIEVLFEIVYARK